MIIGKGEGAGIAAKKSKKPVRGRTPSDKRRNVLSTAVHTQRAAALRMLKLYGRKGELRLTTNQNPADRPSQISADPDQVPQLQQPSAGMPLPYDVLSIPAQREEPDTRHVRSQNAPVTRTETKQLRKFVSPSTSTESSLVMHKHKRRRRRTSHAHKKKRVVTRKSPGTPPPHVSHGRSAESAESIRTQTSLGRGLREWQQWRVGLNEHLASHILSKKERDVRTLPVNSILETMDPEALKAILSVAYKRDTHVTSLSQIAYVVYGIPRVCTVTAGSRRRPSSAQDGRPKRYVAARRKEVSHHRASVHHDFTTSTMISRTSQDSSEYFDPHYDLLKIYREHKHKEEARARIRGRHRRGWVPSEDELAVGRARLTPVTTPHESPDGSLDAAIPPSPHCKRKSKNKNKSYVFRLNFTDITDECESPMYFSCNGYSTSKCSDYNNAPIYRPTTALLRSIRKQPTKQRSYRKTSASSEEHTHHADDSIYLFRPQMAPRNSDHIPKPYRQIDDDNFSLFPHKENQRVPSRNSPPNVPTMYRSVYGNYEHYRHRITENSARYE